MYLIIPNFHSDNKNLERFLFISGIEYNKYEFEEYIGASINKEKTTLFKNIFEIFENNQKLKYIPNEEVTHFLTFHKINSVHSLLNHIIQISPRITEKLILKLIIQNLIYYPFNSKSPSFNTIVKDVMFDIKQYNYVHHSNI